ncbi:hypothetical protein AAF712_008963, partial [Marasmius tenuissimus]
PTSLTKEPSSLGRDPSDEPTITSGSNRLPSFSELNRHLELDGHQKWDPHPHPQSPQDGVNLPGIDELFPHLRLLKG